MTQPPLLGCLLVHRFSLWVLYRQRLKQGGGGGSPAYSREHVSLLCPGPPTVLPLSMHAMEWNSLIFNGLPVRCSLLPRAIWTSDCYCLSLLLSSPLSQVCLLPLSFATVVGVSSARLATIKRSYQPLSRHCWFSFLFAVCRLLLLCSSHVPACQYHVCSWTKYPSRSPLLPLHPLATLLSYCMLPYYTLLTLMLPISPTFSGAVLHRLELSTGAARRGLLLSFELRRFKLMRPTPAARGGLLLLLLLFITHLVSMPSDRNVDLYTAGEYGDLLYDGIDKTVHGAP